ncbi:hypothetical protein [uncultured Shimia sp.]|uniref:hypothetical protein n=1 Tax=uncultured Shimia sp. TaxID=573152 RepID=UPI00263A1AE8|nr:hypothetical protein [uncultured Shimia sp.]
MSSSTTASFVTFIYPFVIGGHKDELPAGNYEVFAEDDVLEGSSFTASRRIATHLLVLGRNGDPELLKVDHRDLETALMQDQLSSINQKNSEAALSPSKDQK